jgi:hypothetical protein
MKSYLNSAQQKQYEEAMDRMHETFARSIFVYRESLKVIVSTDPNFNYLYNNVKGVSQTVRKSQFNVIKARILYMDRQDQLNYDGQVDTQIKIVQNAGEVRIKVDLEGYKFFKDAERVEVDGRMFFKVSDVKKHGMFSPKYYTYYLQPSD